jgi:hypothetical protein
VEERTMNRAAATALGAAAGAALIGAGLYLGHARHSFTTTPSASTSAPVAAAALPAPCAAPATDAGVRMLNVHDVFGHAGAINPEHVRVRPSDCAKPWQVLEAGNLLSPNCDLPFPWQDAMYRDATLSAMGVTELQRVTILGADGRRVTETVLDFADAAHVRTVADDVQLCRGTEAGAGAWTLGGPAGDLRISTARADRLVAVQFEAGRWAAADKARVVAAANRLVAG